MFFEETSYEPLRKMIFYFLKNTRLDYDALYGLLYKDKELKKEYKVWNNYDLEEYQHLIRDCIHEMCFSGELDVRMGMIRINKCISCNRNVEGSIIRIGEDCCSNFTEYIPKEE